MIGLIALGLGTVGIFMPILPTTPFVMLAAGCFSASSSKLSRLLKKSRFFGCYIENYHNKIGIPRRIKYRSIIFLWVSLIISMIVTKTLPIVILLIVVGAVVTIHLITLKTKQEEID
jgi:uncharacterized membrane protein YbaN (DUF454 family)